MHLARLPGTDSPRRLRHLPAHQSGREIRRQPQGMRKQRIPEQYRNRWSMLVGDSGTTSPKLRPVKDIVVYKCGHVHQFHDSRRKNLRI